MKTIKNITKLAFIAILMAAFTANAQTETRVTKTIKMLDFLNKAVIDANQAKGGLHTVADFGELANIKTSRLADGMLAVTADNGKVFRYNLAGTAWVELGIMEVLNTAVNATKDYNVGDVVLIGSAPFTCISAVATGDAYDANKWRKVGDIKHNAVANTAARTALTGMAEGDIAYTTDDDAAVGGNQAATHIYVDGAWALLYKEKATVVSTLATKVLRNAETATALSGTMIVVETGSAVANELVKGVYVRNNVAFAPAVPAAPTDAEYDACWTIISEEFNPGTTTAVTSKVYYSFDAAFQTEAQVKTTFDAAPGYDATEFKDADVTGVTYPNARFFTYAHPADWTGVPVFYMTCDEGAGTVTFKVTDCWDVTDVVINSRRYRVYQTNINFDGITNGTITVK